MITFCFSDNSHQSKLDFDVGEFFMFGSPLALVLAYRRISSFNDKMCANAPKPNINQIYNLFHPTDPVAARLEPLISARFSLLPPVNVARYQKYPLGNGQPYHLRKPFFTVYYLPNSYNRTFYRSYWLILNVLSSVESIQSNPQLFADGLNVPNVQIAHLRRLSEISIQSTMSGIIETVPLQTVSACTY